MVVVLCLIPMVILETVAIHPLSGQLLQSRLLHLLNCSWVCRCLQMVVVLVGVPGLVHVLRLLVGEGVVGAGGGPGAGAALLVAEVHGLVDGHLGSTRTGHGSRGLLAGLLEAVKPVIHTVIAGLGVWFAQFDVRIEACFIRVQNILR